MSQHLKNPIDEEGMQIDPDISAEQLYLAAHFPQVAAIAWNGFENKSRGAVVLTGTVPTAANPSPDNCTFHYFPQNECAALHAAGLQRAIEEYDPATQVVCVVVSAGDPGGSSYQHAHWMTSPQGSVADAAALAPKAR